MRKKKLFILITALLAAAVILFGLLSGSYRPNEQALLALESGGSVTVEQQRNLTVFSPARSDAGFIFYPGGRVDHRAYAPLMRALAEKNILCVLVEMPFDLAVLDANAARGIQERFPEVTLWYIGGHSLGGSMAADYVSVCEEDYEGLVLLASYSQEDLSQTQLPVLSVYGTMDGVLNLENYEKYRENLPEATQEILIRGGNHANFGSYGVQKGDGIPTITAGEQLSLTAAYLHTFFT